MAKKNKRKQRFLEYDVKAVSRVAWYARGESSSGFYVEFDCEGYSDDAKIKLWITPAEAAKIANHAATERRRHAEYGLRPRLRPMAVR
jgi:hypothetical protein